MNNIDMTIFENYETVETALLNDLATEAQTRGKKARTLKGEKYYVKFDGVWYDETPEQSRIYKLIRNNYNHFVEQLNSAKSDILGIWENVWGDRLPDIIANLQKGIEICQKYFDAFKDFIIEGVEEKKEETVEETEEVSEETETETSNDKRELTKEEIEKAPDFMPIKGYEGLYEVGKDGSVWSLNYNRTGQRKQMRPTPYNKYGHLLVNLYKDEKKKTRKVHQLVLNAYLPKPSPELVVMHKNSTPSDNRLKNLKWGTYDENNNEPHAIALQTNHPATSTPVLCVETGEVYPSTHEAERQTGIKQQNISKCCNGKYKTAGGYHWHKVH